MWSGSREARTGWGGGRRHPGDPHEGGNANGNRADDREGHLPTVGRHEVFDDAVGGMEAGMKTVLVLSGVTTPALMGEFPYKPDYVLNNVGEIDLASL